MLVNKLFWSLCRPNYVLRAKMRPSREYPKQDFWRAVWPENEEQKPITGLVSVFFFGFFYTSFFNALTFPYFPREGKFRAAAQSVMKKSATSKNL